MTNKSSKIITLVFILIEVAIYATFLFGDFSNSFETTYIKYVGIIFCFLYTFFTFLKRVEICRVFLPAAFIFTLISDYFLLIRGEEYNLFIYGICSFIVTQIVYFLMINYIRKDKTYFILSLILRAIISLILFFIVTLIFKFDLTSAFAGIYFVQLIFNFIDSIFLISVSKKYLILSIGLLLFIGCDICVGLNNLTILDEFGLNIVNKLMWFFYLPSQTLIALTNLVIKDKRLKIV